MDHLLSSQAMEASTPERGTRRMPLRRAGRAGIGNTGRGDTTNELAVQTLNALGGAKLIRFAAVQEGRQVPEARQGRRGKRLDRCGDHALDPGTRRETRRPRLTSSPPVTCRQFSIGVGVGLGRVPTVDPQLQTATAARDDTISEGRKGNPMDRRGTQVHP
jgi:hypothetical protein